MPNAKFPFYQVRAEFMPATINADNRTIDVCFASDRPVRRLTWDGAIYEILSFDPSHVRMERIQSGAPLLDNHNTWGKIKDGIQLGVVERAWIEGGKGFATVRFSKRDDVEPVFQDVKDGIVRNISVGYNVFTYEKTVTEGAPDTYRAIDWEPAEISLTPVQADITAGVRSDNPDDKQHFQTVNIISLNNRSKMEDETVTTPQGNGGENPPVAGQRSDAPANPPTPPTAPAAPVSGQRADGTDIQAALAAERTRVREIRSACNTAGLAAEFADDLIDRGVGIDAARAAIITKWGEAGAAPTRNQNPTLTGPDEVDKRRSFMSNAIEHRADPSVKLDDGARQYRHLSLIDMAKEVLEANGTKVRNGQFSNFEIAQMALQSRGMMSTSDFPIILGNTINRKLRESYALAPRTFAPFTRKTTSKDFREKTVVQLSQLVNGFDKVIEGGEYKKTKMVEAKEAYKLEKYGRIVPITWEVLINDDLDAFSRIPQAIANQAAQKQSDIVWGIITGNPQMGDGTALFHSSHGNLAGSGGAINVGTVSAARAAMRKQKDLNGKDFINVMAKYMIVGPDKETEAETFLNSIIYPTAETNANIFKGKFELIVEPRLTGNQWYLAASPMVIDTIEYAFLEGEGELFTEQRESFDIDGMEVKARMVFAAKAIDWKGLYKNAGN